MPKNWRSAGARTRSGHERSTLLGHLSALCIKPLFRAALLSFRPPFFDLLALIFTPSKEFEKSKARLLLMRWDEIHFPPDLEWKFVYFDVMSLHPLQNPQKAILSPIRGVHRCVDNLNG
jgi:hypothetical protein